MRGFKVKLLELLREQNNGKITNEDVIREMLKYIEEHRGTKKWYD